MVLKRKVVTTDELKELVDSGARVVLPQVAPMPESVLTAYPAADRTWPGATAEDDPVVSVEYVGREEVQCIRVADPKHLYLTDDFIPTHNTNNIVFLKSTDDSLIETMQKMSGVHHVTRTDSKTITKDQAQIVKATSVEGKVSYTRATVEEPVITANDLQFLPERNAIVFSSGKDPVWNRNETIMPMSWRLFQRKIIKPGPEPYTLKTIPTSSTVKEFDIEGNQPDFEKLLNKRVRQAQFVAEATQTYQEGFGYSDFDMERLDQNLRSAGIMEIIDQLMISSMETGPQLDAEMMDPEEYINHIPAPGTSEPNAEVIEETATRQQKLEDLQRKRYAENQISREMLINFDGTPKRGSLDGDIIAAYDRCRGDMVRDVRYFQEGTNGGLRAADGTVYIEAVNEGAELAKVDAVVDEDGKRVYAESGSPSKMALRFAPTPAFYSFLASLESWVDLAHGEFERSMALAVRRQEEATLAGTDG